MAYLARLDPQSARPIAFPAPAKPVVMREAMPAAEPEFSPLEWSIIRLARVDGLSTLRPPTRLTRLYNWIMGRAGGPELANPKLEALRRISVLSWHFGFTVPGQDVADFLAEGFTLEQYELLVASIRSAIASPSKEIH